MPNPRDPQNLNRYSFVGNNPLRYTDPTGHCFIVCITIKSFNIGKFLNRIFDSDITRAVGWVLMPYYMPYADPYTRTTAVSESAGFAITYFTGCSVCGAAVSGAVAAAIEQSEGKNANILKSAAASAAATAVTEGLDVGLAHVGMDELIGKTAAHVTTSAISNAGGQVVAAQIQGGNLLQAAITGGVTGAVTGAWSSMLPQKKDTRPIWEALKQDLFGIGMPSGFTADRAYSNWITTPEYSFCCESYNGLQQFSNGASRLAQNGANDVIRGAGGRLMESIYGEKEQEQHRE